jgi:hypothetical protein
MTTHSPIYPFQHRENSDGSWDSICLRCYLTAATTGEEQSLSAGEVEHRCYGSIAAAPTYRQAESASTLDWAR